MRDPADRDEGHGPVLVCTGTDAESAAALARRAGFLLAGRRAVVLATWRPPEPRGAVEAVFDAWFDLRETLAADAGTAAEEAAAAAAGELEECGWSVRVEIVRDPREPWEVAREQADAIDASVVVAGTHEGRVWRQGSLGSNVRALAHRAHRPLLVIPPHGETSDGPAFVAFDGSASAAQALDRGAGVLGKRPAVVATAWRSIVSTRSIALAALPAGVAAAGADDLDDASRESAEATAAEGASRLEAAGWTASPVALKSAGAEWPVLVDAAAEREAAVIVCGSRRSSALAATLLGSVAEALLRHSGRPVLLVPRLH